MGRGPWPWFGGLPWPAKAGVAAAVLVTMSAGVLIGAPPSRMPWSAPTAVPQGAVQTPVAVKPSMVQPATPSMGTATSVREVTSELARAGVSLSGVARG
ncbi:MAG TPA: hypothetical protein VLS51_05815 [Propionibacteriaceae bacterium]|nr:hypothetical protein [Propionibacteriaceae bacterium]